MESFREALDRLTRNLVTDLLEAVHAELEEDRAQQERRQAKAQAKAKPKPKRILRTSGAAPAESRQVVVRQFDIPVGQPRSRRARTAGMPRQRRTPPPAQPPAVVKFEVVPHPDRKNRRMVLTRLGTA